MIAVLGCLIAALFLIRSERLNREFLDWEQEHSLEWQEALAAISEMGDFSGEWRPEFPLTPEAIERVWKEFQMLRHLRQIAIKRADSCAGDIKKIQEFAAWVGIEDAHSIGMTFLLPLIKEKWQAKERAIIDHADQSHRLDSKIRLAARAAGMDHGQARDGGILCVLQWLRNRACESAPSAK